ncbi:hypothetical protein OF83DRAFT_391713 [Amylostereum chailletii]|nr:hypothetical protein OF83DRAFT_391713 [Amylostereum chailletii]
MPRLHLAFVVRLTTPTLPHTQIRPILSNMSKITDPGIFPLSANDQEGNVHIVIPGSTCVLPSTHTWNARLAYLTVATSTVSPRKKYPWPSCPRPARMTLLRLREEDNNILSADVGPGLLEATPLSISANGDEEGDNDEEDDDDDGDDDDEDEDEKLAQGRFVPRGPPSKPFSVTTGKPKPPKPAGPVVLPNVKSKPAGPSITTSK